VVKSVAALGVLLACGPARAQPAPDPEQQGAEARRACSSGQVERGIQILSDYLARTHDPTAIFNMGRCYQQNGISDRALLSFREYLRRAPDLPAAERQEVDRTIAELEARSTTPPSLIAPAPRPEGPAGHHTLRITGLALGAAGVAALGTGLVFLFEVRSFNSFRDEVAGGRPTDSHEFARRMDSAATAQTLQFVFLGLGTAAVTAGAVCLALGLPARHETATTLAPWLTPVGAGLALARRY
jgi:hypothetical protein